MINNNTISDFRQASPCELVFSDTNNENSRVNIFKPDCQYDENLLNSIVRMENGVYEGPSATSLDGGYRRLSPDKRIISTQDITTKITERRTFKPFDEHGTDIKPKENTHKISDWANEKVMPKAQKLKINEKTSDSFGFHNDSFFCAFECSMENRMPYMRLDPNINPKLTFVDQLFMERIPRQIIKPVHLGVAIKKIGKHTEQQKIYKGESCSQVFIKPAGLGGHKARVHPGSSEAYRKRINTKKLRQSERDKRKYLNQI